MFGGSYFGALVFGAGLVVTSQIPVPPTTAGGNGFGTTYFGSGVFGAGKVVTSQTPVPPAATGGNGFGTTYFGSGVFGAGLVITGQTPVPPVVTGAASGPGYDRGRGMREWRQREDAVLPPKDRRRQQMQIEAMLLAFLHTQGRN